MIGNVLGNRYEIVEKVGVGGMAIVYRAMDRLLNRYVAVKVLRSEFQDNEEFIRRFNIESQAAASLSHPNIVSIYDVGHSDSLQYIVMEFIEGKTLKAYIAEKKGNIYWKEATDIAMQICSALEHAHAKHIIHRDIKPQNIMINTEGVIKVTDFGIARAANNGTMTMEAMGSAHYLSPEQARGGYTDQRSDIYSLGVLLYELFTGQLPFDGETTVAVAMQHMQVEPVKPRNIKEDLPKSIENIILKAMSKEQRLRYESAGAMLQDIKKAYTDPEGPVKFEDESDDKFGTKKIEPIVNITMPTNDAGKSVVRRNTEERVVKKNKKSDSVAIIAAVVTCFVIAIVMGVMVANMLPKHKNNVETEEAEMISVMGMTREKAYDQLQNLVDNGYKIGEPIFEYHRDYDEGVVIKQYPTGGNKLTKNDVIVLTISRGKEEINLDDYTGYSAEEVIEILEDKGIVVNTSQEMSDDIEEGFVIRQLPTVGNVVETGDSVRLFISSGAKKFDLDDYTKNDMSVEAIKGALSQNGIVVEVIEEYNDTVPQGKIIRQTPDAGKEMKKGDKVQIIVSKGVEMVKVPNVVGIDVDKARDALTNMNLKCGTETEVDKGMVKGIVVEQSIPHSEMVKKGTVIDLKISKGVSVDPAGGSVVNDPSLSDTGI